MNFSPATEQFLRIFIILKRNYLVSIIGFNTICICGCNMKLGRKATGAESLESQCKGVFNKM